MRLVHILCLATKDSICMEELTFFCMALLNVPAFIVDTKLKMMSTGCLLYFKFSVILLFKQLLSCLFVGHLVVFFGFCMHFYLFFFFWEGNYGTKGLEYHRVCHCSLGKYTFASSPSILITELHWKGMTWTWYLFAEVQVVSESRELICLGFN